MYVNISHAWFKMSDSSGGGVDVGRPHAEGVQGLEQGARQAAQADPAGQVRTGSAPGGGEIRTGADCLHPGVHCQRDRDG